MLFHQANMLSNAKTRLVFMNNTKAVLNCCHYQQCSKHGIRAVTFHLCHSDATDIIGMTRYELHDIP